MHRLNRLQTVIYTFHYTVQVRHKIKI